MSKKHGHQSKLESLIEQLCNVGSGMIIAYTMMQLVLAPLLTINITPSENVVVTIVLTIVSVTRGYFWRRFFNRKLYHVWADWLVSRFPSLKRIK